MGGKVLWKCVEESGAIMGWPKGANDSRRSKRMERWVLMGWPRGGDECKRSRVGEEKLGGGGVMAVNATESNELIRLGVICEIQLV